MDKRAKTLLIFSIITALALAVFAVYILTASSPVALASLSSENITSPINASVTLLTRNVSEDTYNIINISITEQNSSATKHYNITDINVTFWNFSAVSLITSDVNLLRFDAGINFDKFFGNGTNLSINAMSVLNITNTTGGTGSNNRVIIRFENGTVGKPLINSSETGYLWFNVSIQAPGLYNITVALNYTNGTNAAEKVNVKTNLTLIVNDTVRPTVNDTYFNSTVYLDPDLHGAVNNTDGTGISINSTTRANFTCNMSDDGGITAVTLYLWEVLMGTSIGRIHASTINYPTIMGTTNQSNFTLQVTVPGTYKWACAVTDTYGLQKYSSSNYTITMNSFNLTGWVKNTTYSNLTISERADVTIFEFVQNQSGGPPTDRAIATAQTSATGQFNFTNIVGNGTNTMYKLKVTINDSAGNAIAISPALPPLPRDPLINSLDGGDIYTQNATSIQLYAYTNATKETELPSRFGYMVMDENYGFPIVSDPMNFLAGIKINVSANRNYTIMFVRTPMVFINATPPLSIRINGSCITNPVSGCNITGPIGTDFVNFSANRVTINKSVIFGTYNLTACINITGNSSYLTPANGSLYRVNITNLTLKMLPWPGFVPPLEFELVDFSQTDTNTIKYGNNSGTAPGKKGCQLASLNLSLMGATSGVDYLVEAYAVTNHTQERFSALQNLTITTSDFDYNITMRGMLGKNATGWLGSSTAQPTMNASSVRVRFKDDNGTAISQGHVEVIVKNPVSGTLHYIQSLNSEGFFYQYLSNDTTEMKVRIFNQQFAPKEVLVPLSNNETNISLYPFKPQLFNESGQVSSNITGTGVTINFLRYTPTCNVVDPDVATCRIGSGSFTASFDPLRAMMAGKSNMLVQYATGSRVYFIDVDLIASGPPDVQVMENASKTASSSTSLADLWKFGSVAPEIYQEVWVGIPYNSTYNESWTYFAKLPLLSDHDQNLRWNASTNTTAQIPADYADFNSLFFSDGLECSKSSYINVTGSGSTYCYMNTSSNMLWVRLPHFSSLGTQIAGSYSPPGSTTGTSGGPGGGGPAGAAPQDVGALSSAVTKEFAPGDKIKFTLITSGGTAPTNHTINLLGMTGTTVSVQFYSAVVTKNLALGQTTEIDLDKDGKNDISVTVDKIDLTKVKATLTIKPLVGVIAPVTPTTNVTPTPTTPTPTQPTAPAAPTEGAEAGISPLVVVWVGIAVAIVAVIVVAVALAKKKKKF